MEYWSDGRTPDRAWRPIPAYRINCVAAAGLRHSRAPGKRRGENRVEVGKWCNFFRLVTGFYRVETALTRLFPLDSTQVVDFPCIYAASNFWGNPEIVATDETQIEHGFGTDEGRKGTHQAETGARTARTYAGKVTGFYAKLRESSRKFAQIRAVVTRCLASQARHKMGAQVGCSLAQNVVALLRVGPIFREVRQE